MQESAAIYAYLDYRAFLRDFLGRKKAAIPRYSLRLVASKMGCSPAFFVRVVNGTRNIGAAHVLRLAQIMELGTKERRYFELLVNYNQAKPQTEKDHWFGQIESYQTAFVKEVSARQYGIYSRWYYLVVREMLHVLSVDGEAPDALRRLGLSLDPPIKAAEVREALDVLLDAGAISRGAGRLGLSERFIRSGGSVPPVIVNRVLLEFMDLARRAIDRFPREERSMSALTFSVSPQGYAKVMEIVAQCRKEALAAVHADTGEADRVYHLNLHLFPVSRRMRGGRVR